MTDTQLAEISAAKQRCQDSYDRDEANPHAGEQEWNELVQLLNQTFPVPDGFTPDGSGWGYSKFYDDGLARSLDAKVPGADASIAVYQTERGELIGWLIEGRHKDADGYWVDSTCADLPQAVAIARDLLLAVEHAKCLGYTESGGTP